MTRLLGLLLLLTTSVMASEFERCCLCIADPTDKVLGEQHCQRWAGDEAQRTCDVKKVVASELAPLPALEKSCRRVEIRAAFHGESSKFYLPFKIAKAAADLYSPESIDYSGYTCLLFNNTNMVKTQAQFLAQSHKGVKFSFAGNQNIGLVEKENLSEIYDASSKMFVNIESGLLTVSYDKCSKPKLRCGYDSQDISAQSDANSKICEDAGELKEQRCCQDKRERDRGAWAKPNESCKR